jgi:glutathione S-transferase
VNPADPVATPQPPPAMQGGREVLPDLVALLRSRSDFGFKKYQVRLHTENGRDAYIDALQELLDLFVYLHQAQMERAQLEEDLATARADLASHVAALDARIETLKAERDAARENLARSRQDLEAELAANHQLAGERDAIAADFAVARASFARAQADLMARIEALGATG